MSCSPALKWLIVLLLPLTLGWKLTVRADDASELSGNLVEFFARHHFGVIVTEDDMGQSPIIQATASACRVLAGKISSDGGNWRLPKCRWHLYRMHNARLSGQVHAVYESTTGIASIVCSGADLWPGYPRSA